MLNIFFYLILFLFGLTVGSFLNSIIYRLNTGESFLLKRSYCPHCKQQLSWPDLIPVLSFLILRGKCRYCKKPISLQYPLVELVTGILFVFVVFQWLNGSMASWLNLIYLLFAIAVLILVFVSDLKYYIIPDKVIYPAIVAAFFYNLISDLSFNHSLFFSGIFSAFLASAFFLAIVFASRGKWLGLGDVKLATFMGLLLGWPNILVALFLSFFIGALIGGGLVISGKKNLKSEVPFGPFLVTGTFIALFWGEKLINRYLNLFF